MATSTFTQLLSSDVFRTLAAPIFQTDIYHEMVPTLWTKDKRLRDRQTVKISRTGPPDHNDQKYTPFKKTEDKEGFSGVGGSTGGLGDSSRNVFWCVPSSVSHTPETYHLCRLVKLSTSK